MRSPVRLLGLLLLVCLIGLPLDAATYMPMSDADLVRLADAVVRAEVVEKAVRLDRVGDSDRPFTVLTMRRLELFKGELEETFRVVLPGGIAGGIAWSVPGTPAFDAGQEVILMLHALPGRIGEFGLSEFGLSKFDMVTDQTGRGFLVRPVFSAREDVQLAKRGFRLAPLTAQEMEARTETPAPARDAESFLAALRRLRAVEPLGEVAYVMPVGGLARHRTGLRTKWANLGGVELGNCGGVPCLFKWFFETGASPPATVFVTGTQTNLVASYPPCGVDQTCLVQAALNNWHNIAATDIRISGPTPTGNFEIKLDMDVAHNGTSWTTPYDCTNGGVAGIGGPLATGGAKTFKGLSPYYSATTATVSMRRFTCSYPSDAFLDILTHEMGHGLGLHHPDQHQSVHSTTTQAQWNAAIMFSSTHTPPRTTPQADDIQAMQFYYGTAAPGPMPAANFSFTPSAPSAGAPVSFTDTSTNTPTGWLWFFGESTSSSNFSRDRNPTHTYAGPGTYTVDLISGNLNGGGRITKQVVVGGSVQPCVVSATVLCLNGSRFKVEVSWRVPSQGRSGVGTAVPLTGDTGYFWFFNSANVELVLKVLDARGVNGKFWVFYGALSDVEYTITVTDTLTGAVKTYFNEDHNLASFADTAAFAGVTIGPEGEEIATELASAEEIERLSATELYGMYAALTQVAPVQTDAAACAPNSTTLCLTQGRFQLRVTWAVPSQGRTGDGMAVPITTDTGYFWFFSSANVELIVKALDARGVNGHFWVFYGALSNVEYTITITDTQTGAVKTYHNNDGDLASVADIQAF